MLILMLSAVYKHLKGISCIYKEQKRHLKSVALLTKEKGKTAMNELENDDSDNLQALYSVYKET